MTNNIRKLKMAYKIALETLEGADQIRIQAKQYSEKQIQLCNSLHYSCEDLRLFIEDLETQRD